MPLSKCSFAELRFVSAHVPSLVSNVMIVIITSVFSQSSHYLHC